MTQGHLNALESKHAELASRIDKEEARPSPDGVTLHNLKKQKLALKDQIASLHSN